MKNAGSWPSKRRGVCLYCGVRTHIKKNVVILKASTDEHVWQGHCIRCEPEAVPTVILEQWKRQYYQSSSSPIMQKGRFSSNSGWPAVPADMTEHSTSSSSQSSFLSHHQSPTMSRDGSHNSNNGSKGKLEATKDPNTSLRLAMSDHARQADMKEGSLEASFSVLPVAQPCQQGISHHHNSAPVLSHIMPFTNSGTSGSQRLVDRKQYMMNQSNMPSSNNNHALLGRIEKEKQGTIKTLSVDKKNSISSSDEHDVNDLYDSSFSVEDDHDVDDNQDHRNEDDDDALAQALAELNIDEDFNISSSSFCISSQQQPCHTSRPTLNPVDQGQEQFTQEFDSQSADTATLQNDDGMWAQRWERDEIYSPRYHPSEVERNELLDLDRSIRDNGGTNSSTSGSSCTTVKPPGMVLQQIINTVTSIATGNSTVVAQWDQWMMNNSGNDLTHPATIVLKRGRCLWQTRQSLKQTSQSPLQQLWQQQQQLRSGITPTLDADAVECEVILLTVGMAIVTTTTATTMSQSTVPQWQLTQAIPWSKIRYVQPDPTPEENVIRNAALGIPSQPSAASHPSSVRWQVLLDTDEVWTFICSTTQQQQHWLQAMEQVLVQYHMRYGEMEGFTHMPWGWQYQYVHKPAFSMAVTNRPDVVRPPRCYLSCRDEYNGYTPLHYAVRNRNARAVHILLKMGADPNAPDRDDRLTPTDYALQELDQMPKVILNLLQAAGGKGILEHRARVTASKGDPNKVLLMRGELFGQVAAVNEKRRSEQERQQQQWTESPQPEEQAIAPAAATKATQQQGQIIIMNENRQSWQQRGETIQQMRSKANELNESARDYFSSLAQQVKHKAEKQAKLVSILK